MIGIVNKREDIGDWQCWTKVYPMRARGGHKEALVEADPARV